MADMQHLFKEAWQQAMVGLDAAGTGVDKVLDQIAGAVRVDELVKEQREGE